jgi:hypothetical protein
MPTSLHIFLFKTTVKPAWKGTIYNKTLSIIVFSGFFFFVLCNICCQYLWLVNFWLPLRCSKSISSKMERNPFTEITVVIYTCTVKSQYEGGAIKNWPARDTGNICYTKQRKKNHWTQYVLDAIMLGSTWVHLGLLVRTVLLLFYFLVLSYCVSLRSEFCVVMYVTISAWKQLSVGLYLQLFVRNVEYKLEQMAHHHNLNSNEAE